MRPPPVALHRRHWLACALALAAARPAVAATDTPFRPWPRSLRLPVLQLPQQEGGHWSLAALHGKPVLLNFWASWCEPCRTEMPALELLATRHESQGLQVVAINFRETDAAVRRFVETTGLSLPVLRDPDGAAAHAFGARVFPFSVGIHRQGRPVWTVVGEIDWAAPAARQAVARLMA